MVQHLFSILVVLSVVAMVAGWKAGCARHRARRSSTPTLESGQAFSEMKGALATPSLGELDWQAKPPLVLRPFKPIYHITMAVQKDTPDELITIDYNYKARVEERSRVIFENASTVIGAIPEGHAAVAELYAFLLSDYLPTRYPKMFTLSNDGKVFRNHVTQKVFQTLPPKDPLEAWRRLGETVEDDMFLLRQTEDGHQAVAFLCCFPAGFDPSSKLGLVLKDIHGPVPSYDKIGPSMERFFAKLEVGKSVKRMNWTITREPDLFSPSGNHVHEGDVVDEDQEVDIDKARLRIELQTLTRLPQTRAILFSFKTFTYHLKDIKEEGLGPDLADAVEGLKKGNAPGMWVYKGGIIWGKSICKYLRS